MGLAGPRKRTKISHDPNNTKWTKDTGSFGHKILAAQGWTPGQFLGAKNANHSNHYTQASAGHVRVLLKDDNLGLGAKTSAQNPETFGLSMYSGLLGRLNGKSDQALEKEQTARRDVELALYQGRKWGHLNFVSAGYLLGDKIEKAEEPLRPTLAMNPAEDRDQSVKREKRSVKRKAESESGEMATATQEEEKAGGDDRQARDAESKEERRQRISQERAEKRTKGDKSRGEVSAKSEDGDSPPVSEAKAAKAARKEERRRRREERRAQMATATTTTTTTTDEQISDISPSGTSTPTTTDSGSSTMVSARPFVGRQAVRQRYIQQKRLAAMDPQALKEVCISANVLGQSTYL